MKAILLTLAITMGITNISYGEEQTVKSDSYKLLNKFAEDNLSKKEAYALADKFAVCAGMFLAMSHDKFSDASEAIKRIHKETSNGYIWAGAYILYLEEVMDLKSSMKYIQGITDTSDTGYLVQFEEMQSSPKPSEETLNRVKKDALTCLELQPAQEKLVIDMRRFLREAESKK